MDILKCNESRYDKEMTEMKDYVSSFKIVADNCLINNQSISRFIEIYLPVKIQQQISETLQSILSKPFLDKLEKYDFRKFPELNKALLEGN